jgi:hypothetical protein
VGSHNNLNEVVGNVLFPSGVIVVCSVPSGLDTFDATAARVPANLAYDAITIDEFFDVNSRSRLIGGAVEVINTTEELNKSGSLTVYRFENEADMTEMAMSNVGVFTQDARIKRKRLPPQTLANAKLVDGITWSAKDGLLMPLVQSSDDNHPLRPNPQIAILEGTNGTAYVPAGATNAGSLVGGTGLPFATDLAFMSSGGYFTGLSDETTLTISIRFFIESFPLPGNDLVALAHPSPAVDWRAMQYLSEIQGAMIAGFPVDMNAKGDFFRRALGIVRKLAKMSHGPLKLLGTVYPAAAVAAQVADLIAEKDKKKKNQKTQIPRPIVQSGSKRIG